MAREFPCWRRRVVELVLLAAVIVVLVVPDAGGENLRYSRLLLGAQNELISRWRASFKRFAGAQPGRVGLAIAPLSNGRILTFGDLQVGHAWSTMKVPVLVTVLAQLEQRGRTLDAHGRDYAARALERSDNTAAEALFSRLERMDGGLVGASVSVQDILRRAGDQSTVINTAPNRNGFTTWGQSEWSASGEVAFFRSLALGCLVSSSDTRYVLTLMRRVEPDQRWGAGSAGHPRGLPIEFKGGWGPEHETTGYLVRQSAIVGSAGRGTCYACSRDRPMACSPAARQSSPPSRGG